MKLRQREVQGPRYQLPNHTLSLELEGIGAGPCSAHYFFLPKNPACFLPCRDKEILNQG